MRPYKGDFSDIYKRSEIRNGSFKDCSLCRRSLSRTNIIGSLGSLDSYVAFQGVSPGSQEDIQANIINSASLWKPYFDRYLRILGLSIGQIYFTNLLRCYKKGSVKKDEIEACIPWKRAEFRKLGSKVIFLMGQVSVESILDTKGVSIRKLLGRVYEIGNKWFIPIYHPQSVYVNIELREEAERFLLNLRKELRIKYERDFEESRISR